MGNFLNIFFNPGHFQINNNPAEFESDSDDENVQIPIANQVIDHDYTNVLTNLLDIERKCSFRNLNSYTKRTK